MAPDDARRLGPHGLGIGPVGEAELDALEAVGEADDDDPGDLAQLELELVPLGGAHARTADLSA